MFPPAVYHQQEDGEASAALQKASIVLVRQEGHKSYRGPYQIKSRKTSSYSLEGGNLPDDWVVINHLKPFNT